MPPSQILFRFVTREVDIPVAPQRAVDVSVVTRKEDSQSVEKTVLAPQAQFTHCSGGSSSDSKTGLHVPGDSQHTFSAHRRSLHMEQWTFQ